jgi:hypothetical protein
VKIVPNENANAIASKKFLTQNAISYKMVSEASQKIFKIDLIFTKKWIFFCPGRSKYLVQKQEEVLKSTVGRGPDTDDPVFDDFSAPNACGASDTSRKIFTEK